MSSTEALDSTATKVAVPTGTSVLEVEQKEIVVFIEYRDLSGKSCRKALNIHPECTLGFLKEEIYAQLKIAPEDQNLWFGRFELHKESAKRELPELKIVSRSVLRLESASGESTVVSTAGVVPVTDKSLPKAPATQAPWRPALSKEESVRRNKLLRAELRFDELQRDTRDSLVKWSLYFCRAVFVFFQICLMLFFASWGHWEMVYYVLAMIFSVMGWYGSRRLSTGMIYFFCFFLCMDMILMLEAVITTGEEKKDHGYSSYGVFIVVTLFEMFLIGGFMSLLFWFGWKIRVAKQLGHVVVDVAEMYCRDQVVLV